MTRSVSILVCLLALMVTMTGVSCNVLEIFKQATPTPAPTTSPNVIIPNAPSNLVATAKSFRRIDLKWQDNSDNEDKFVIVRRTAGGKYSLRATVGTDVTSYRDIGLSEETTYYYRVSALNDAGNSPYSNEYSATTPRSIPVYHAVGTSVQGQKQSLSVVSVYKTDRYCTYLQKCLAPPGSAFVAVVVSTTNHHSDILIVKRNDFVLRDSATHDRYAMLDYQGGVGSLLGEPLPKESWLSEGQTASGVVVYYIPETASLSEMEVVYVLDGKEHAWQP